MQLLEFRGLLQPMSAKVLPYAPYLGQLLRTRQLQQLLILTRHVKMSVHVTASLIAPFHGLENKI